jgi:hypothetical protein
MDEVARREQMEASENTALPRQGGSEFSLHRVDPDRVSRLISSGADPVGYARLSLMVGPIFDRLTSGRSPENR